MKNLTKGLLSITKELEGLAQKTADLALAIENATREIAGSAKKEPPQKSAPKNAQPATPTDQVLKIMKRYKNGINVAKLRDKSGLNEKQISNIVHRASKNGKMKRIGRGIYSVFNL